MEIMNGQEMLQYDSKPDSRYVERAFEAIEGSAKMGNQGGIGNAQATWGASSDDFGKNLVKRIKASTNKRSEETPTLNLRGRDIQADLKDTGHRPYAIEENNKTNNNNQQIKESMKRLKFKKDFNGLGNALKLIPESYRVDNKTFEMTDGNETYKIRWEGNLSEGKAVVLTASDKKMVNEDINRMKELFSYKSQNTLGLVKGNARVNENKVFGDIWNKSKQLLGEGEDIESADATEGDLDKAVSQSPEAKKHVEGSVSTDKGTKAPKAKVGDLDKAVSQSPEAKKYVEGSASAEKGTKAPAPKQGHWEDTGIGHASEAKKYVHLKENMTDEEIMEEEELMREIEEDMKNMGINEIGDGSNYPPGTENDPNSPWNQNDEEEEEEESEEEEGDDEEGDDWNKPEVEDSFDEKEPTASDIKKTGIPIGIDDEDDEDEIQIPLPPKKKSKNEAKLLFSPSSGQYWIISKNDKFQVPSEYLSIASDSNRTGSEKAALIIKKIEAANIAADYEDDSFEKTDFGLDEYGMEHNEMDLNGDGKVDAEDTKLAGKGLDEYGDEHQMSTSDALKAKK